jgi:hypothetical protein
MIHHIRIFSDPAGYRIAGAVSLKVAFNPMRAAAAALLDAGHDPADRVAGVYEGAQISPVALDKLARSYAPPRAVWGPGRDAHRARAA